jgi:hypothetical protein
MPFDGAELSVPYNRLNQIEDVIWLIGTPDKWCKRRRRTSDRRFCIYGALTHVNARNLEPLVLQAINQETGKRYRRIEAFNDKDDTTHALVLLRVLARARDGQQVAADACRAPGPSAPGAR